MTRLESNRCHVCSKIFCCEDCCADHIRKKHPTSREPKCPLCRSERLMVKNFENNVILLCHIVFNHLPLHCRYCGKEFKNNNDLQCIGTCSRRAIVKNVTEVSYSFLSPDALSSLNKTPSERLSIKIKDFSITGGYNENFINFSSPPERMRNTSTPMNNNLAGYCKTSFGFKTPRSPNVSIKTPKTANSIANDLLRKQFLLNRQNGSVTSATVYKDTESSTSDLKFYSVSSISRSALGGTPLRSILCNKSTSSENSDQEYSRTTGRRLGSMKEINEEMGIEEIARIDMDLMDSGKSVLAPLNVAQPKEQKDSAKRVRFSDEFEAKSEAEISTASYFDATDNDEFFEARQSFSDSPVAVETVSNLQENEEEKSATKLADSCDLSNRENEENCEKEKTENLVDTQTLDFGDNDRLGNLLSSSSSVTPSTSRVVMMVVVEKNGRVDTNDLRSLIDSSLKKVEGLSKPISPIRLHMELPRSTQNNASTENSVVSVDSYLTFSTLDCSSKPDLTLNIPERRQPEIDNAGATTGGIFSVMAQAMKTAFRNFSEAATLKHVREKELPPALPSTSTETDEASSNVLNNLALVPRSGKRSRDLDEPLPTESSFNTVDRVENVTEHIRSPVSKRPRGWYKIRAREPIARMKKKNSSSSPGEISEETQCFQQGSVNVRDTILYLPSRAHQSTQTE